MTKDMLDRWLGILASAGLHQVLLLGSLLVFVEQRFSVGGEGSGFICSVREREVKLERIDRTPDVFRREISKSEAFSTPETILAEELASAFRVERRSSGCVACAAERRTGHLVVLRVSGPQGLCCRHVMMLDAAGGFGKKE